MFTKDFKYIWNMLESTKGQEKAKKKKGGKKVVFFPELSVHSRP